MESNTGKDAPNTAEENQVTETEIEENTEVENSADPEPTTSTTTEDAAGEQDAEAAGEQDAEAAGEQDAEAAGEQDAEAANNEEECPDSEIGVEASGEGEQGNTTKDDNNEKGDEAAESNDKENESIEKMDEDKNSDEKQNESEKKDDNNEEKETEKLNYEDLAPWFNEELHRLCKKNQQLYRRARENKNQTRIWEEFKEHQNDVHQQIRKIKREYQEKNSLSDDDMAKLSTKSASRAREYGLLDFDVKVITDGRNLKEPENKGGAHKREHGGWISPQEKRKREQVMREYYKMYY